MLSMESRPEPLQDSIKCPACAVEMLFGEANGAPRWVRCPECKLMMRHPMPLVRELDKMYAKAYSPTAVKLDSTGFESEEGMLVHLAAFLIDRFFRPGDRILDFGAGSGRFCRILRDAGFQVDGVELAAEPRAEAKARFGFEFRSTLSEMRENYYDWVVAIEVLEHLPDPEHTLVELRSRLKPGAAVFLTTPNASGLQARLNRFAWREAQNPFHLILFTFPALKQLLARAQYRDVQSVLFSPVGAVSPGRWALHRALQLLRLYGSIRVVARNADA